MDINSKSITQILRPLDRRSPIPFYVQIKEAIRDQIENGSWRTGDRIYGEDELCRHFGVSQIVVKQALKELSYEGLIERKKGKGTYVTAPKIKETMNQIVTGFFQDMVSQGYLPKTEVIKKEVVLANSKVAEQLQLKTGVEVWELERLRFIRNEPVTLIVTYLNYDLCPGLMEVDLSNKSLYEFLFKEYGHKVVRGKRIIEACVASKYEADLLKITRGSPLLKIDGVSFLEDGTPIEYYHGLHRGDRSQFEFEVGPVSE